MGSCWSILQKDAQIKIANQTIEKQNAQIESLKQQLGSQKRKNNELSIQLRSINQSSARPNNQQINPPNNQQINPQPYIQPYSAMPMGHRQIDPKDQQLDRLNLIQKTNEKYIQELRRQLAQKPRAAVDQNIDAFCQGEILNDDEDYKIFLRQTLQRRLKRKIRKTKSICHEHPLNNNNLHEYIDGIDNVLVILQVQETGYIVAAWTQKAFKYMRIEEGDGVIVSLTKRIEFGKLPGKKAINYDETYLIFGNADLRFNNDTKSLYSNFGTSTSYYENKGYRVDTLMGKQQRELKLKSYEIYQLQFE